MVRMIVPTVFTSTVFQTTIDWAKQEKAIEFAFSSPIETQQYHHDDDISS